MERITVQRAAELTGTSALTIRKGLERGEFKFGSAVHISKHRTIFHISPALLAEYLGLTVEQVKGDKE